MRPRRALLRKRAARLHRAHESRRERLGLRVLATMA